MWHVCKHLLCAKHCAWHWEKKEKKVDKTDTVPTSVKLGGNCDPGTRGRKHRELSEHRKGSHPVGEVHGRFLRKGATEDQGKDAKHVEGAGVMSSWGNKGSKPDCRKVSGFGQVRGGVQLWGDRGEDWARGDMKFLMHQICS